jgi:tRNA(fMet)-specific endonuclease VapC
MYILDTDHMSALEWGSGAAGQRLLARLNQLSPGAAVTTIVTFEEQSRGWLAVLAQARKLSDQVEAYRRLQRLLLNYLKIDVVAFDTQAAAEFEQLRRQRIRIGTMDLKIAAIALTHRATVLTCNHKDFSRVPGLSIEDWTV